MPELTRLSVTFVGVTVLWGRPAAAAFQADAAGRGPWSSAEPGTVL